MPDFPSRIVFITLLVLTSAQFNLSAQIDSLALPSDSINIAAKIDQDTYDSAINKIITYPAEDSTIYHIESQTVHMYKNAKVTYGDITLEADYISYDFSRMEVTAHGLPDSSGTVIGKPLFKQGNSAFNSDTIRYNFTTQKGLIQKVVTQDGDSYVHSEISKKQDNGDIHNYGGKYTTCSNENPHYHFRFKKMVVKPNDKIVTGPIFMKIGKVPVPLGLPFGFFPNTTKQKAGIIIPGYGQSPSLGFFLINGGYYLPLGDRMDTKLTGDIYSRGSWGLRNITRYIKRYKHTGNFDLTYNKQLNGDPDLANFSSTSSFFVRWSHSQNTKARPGTSFSSSINAGTSNSFRNNYNSSQQDYISNTFTSSVNYSKRWTASQLTLSARHSQNTSNRSVSFTLPQIGFNLNRFFLPLSFLRQSEAGGKRWYETIGVTYNSTFENRLNTTEPQLQFDNFSSLSREIVNGVRHNVSASTSIKAGYISISPSFRLTERWHFAREELSLIADETVTDTVGGFFATRDYSFSTNMTTKLYGMFNFRGDGLKAIRHVMTPSLGFSYSPEFDYRDEIEVNGDPLEYNPYVVSAYSQSSFSGERGAVNFSLQNNLEAKYLSKSDSTGSRETKKMKILENLRASTSYNLMADSLNLSNISISARTTLYKNTSVQYSGTFDPYDISSTGQRINKYRISGSGPWLRANNHNVAFTTRLSGGKNNKKEKNSDFASNDELEQIANNKNRYVDFNVPWNLNLSYTLNMRNSYQFTNDRLIDTTFTQQGILFNGDIRILQRWKVGVNSGYDFTEKDWTATSVSFYWDLHCWEFQANIIPIGERKSYNFRIGVKAPILQDLKLQRRGNLGTGEGLLQ